jgi:hypothetical protein
MANNHCEPNPGAFASHNDTSHQRASSSEPSASCSPPKQLPVEFQPSNDSIVCGRGKYSFNHIGNCRFRVVASLFLERYSRADSKAAKTAIISGIIEVIRQAGGIFCKFKSGAWIEVDDIHAREKVSALLRDLLHTQYRSSAKPKPTAQKAAVRPKEYQKQQSSQKRVEGNGDSDDSSTTSSCWGRSKNSLGFEYWLEEPDDFFDTDVF